MTNSLRSLRSLRLKFADFVRDPVWFSAASEGFNRAESGRGLPRAGLIEVFQWGVGQGGVKPPHSPTQASRP